MPKLTFVDLCLLSQTERRALIVPLNSQKVVIQGGNGFGKSAIIKSLYETLGATPQKIDSSWRAANVSSCLRFEIDGVRYAVVKALGIRALFDSNSRPIFMGQGLVKDWGPRLAAFLGFKLVMSDRSGETLTPPPSYIFAPFYIDQDISWTKAWASFADFYLPDSSKTLAEYHSGLKPDRYYEAKAALQKERLALSELEAALRTLRETLAQVQDISGDVSPIYDLEEYEAEIADLVTESTILFELQAARRRQISDLHEKVHLLRAERTLIEGTLAEMRGEFDFAVSLPNEVECPTCGQGYHNSLADRFALIADEGVLIDALGRVNAKLMSAIEAQENELQELDAVRLPLKRIEDILDTRRATLSLGDVMLATGKTEAAKILRTSLNEKLEATTKTQGRIDKYKADMDSFTSKRRSAEILSEFRSRLTANAIELDVRLEDPSRQSISTIKAARGSEGPRALLAYYYAFLQTRSMTPDRIDCPLVIDAPNQQGQDAVHLPQMLKFIFKNVPTESQVIVAIEDVGDVDLSDVDIRTYGERKRQILREADYASAEAFMKPFTDAILASTATR